MNRLNSLVLLVLCVQLEDMHPPLTTEQFYCVEKKLKKYGEKHLSALLHLNEEQLYEYLHLDDELITIMMNRIHLMDQIIQCLARFERLGISVITKYDEYFPTNLQGKLKKRAPVYFFSCGKPQRIRRSISISGLVEYQYGDVEILNPILKKANQYEYTYISNDAMGIDALAIEYLLENGGNVILVVANHFFEKQEYYKKYIKNGQIQIISVTNPTAKFNITNALERNTYVYGLSDYHFIIKANLNAGATWFSALQNIYHKWTNLFVVQNESIGNLRLIDMGGVPLLPDKLSIVEGYDELYALCHQVISETVVDIDQLSIYDFLEDEDV